METRETVNYGKKIISVEDIDYMFSILDSNLSDINKALKLYSFCNLYNFSRNLLIYERLQLPGFERLKELEDIYTDFNEKGFFDSFKHSYRCSLEEVELRLTKLNKAMDIVNSDMSDYRKAEELLKLYKDSETLRKSYSLFIKNGDYDRRLDRAREALDNFDSIFSAFKCLEENGVVDFVRYVSSIEDYCKNYQYACFVLQYYIASSNSYDEKLFYDELGIDKEIFKFCIDTIKELNPDLYIQYENKSKQNNEINISSNIVIIHDLAEGINKGVLSDGTSFDLLEFLKRVPFECNENFMREITQFMKEYTPDDYSTIFRYLHVNKLSTKKDFLPLDIESLYETRTIVNGVEVTNEDKDIIIDYLRVNNIPVINRAYICARKKYLDGTFSLESVNEQKEVLSKNRKKAKILIPNGK